MDRVLGRNLVGFAIVLSLIALGANSASASVPALDFLKKFPELAGFARAGEELGRDLNRFSSGSVRNGQFLQVGRSNSQDLQTLRFQQSVDGIQVLGAQSLRHSSANQTNGLLAGFSGDSKASWTHNVAQFELDTRPSLTADEALLVARSEAPEQELSSRPRLLIVPNWQQNSARLVYRIEIAGHDEVAGRIVDVDAHTGRIVASISRHWEIAPIDVYQTVKTCQTLSPIADSMGGRAPISVDYKRCKKVIAAGVAKPYADDQAQQAFANSQHVLDYYWSAHRRDSFDGNGGLLVGIVHVGDKWSNAFWNSEEDIMAYGDGDGAVFRNLTLSVDVAGHEMTHGVVSKTANLEYLSESGALNEGFADFFGETIEGQKDWVMGRDLFVDPKQGENGIRSLKDPHKTTYKSQDANGNLVRRPAPAKYSEIFKFENDSCDRSNDNCGVHMNATLIGHTGYLLVNEMGKEMAEKIFYTTLVHYLTETSDFHAFGKGMRQACASLYTSTDCAVLEKVLTQVEL